MTRTFKVGCIQFCADNDSVANLKLAKSLIRKCHEAGADFICLAEYFAAIETDDQTMLMNAVSEDQHPALLSMQSLCKELSVWMQIGSLPIRISDTQVNNRAFVINNLGEIVARYNKIHLFDVTLKNAESYKESTVVKAGDELVLADLPWGKLGMSVCYDLRFPEQYRKLAKQGADFISVPAAFTQTTGEVHWHVLLRARAIENSCYIFATCQNGIRHTGRATYGHSLIIDPWGNILADGGDETGFIVAEIDPNRVAEVREMIPSLSHDRNYH